MMGSGGASTLPRRASLAQAASAVGLLAVLLALTFAPGAEAYVECGDAPGTARNVTAVRVSCSDARAFAQNVARRGVRHSGWIALPGWHAYYARVRRVGGEYDVRATSPDRA